MSSVAFAAASPALPRSLPVAAPALRGATPAAPATGTGPSAATAVAAAAGAVTAITLCRRSRRSTALAARKAAAAAKKWQNVRSVTVSRSAAAPGTEPGRKVDGPGRRSVATDVEIAQVPPPNFDYFAEETKEEKAEEKEASTETEKGPMFEQFQWKKQWYALHVVEIMDPGRPHKTQLLGINVVIWNDGPVVNGKKEMGKWRCFEDVCPHRMAPLSEGRVEDDGNLLCSYHAWRFNGEGNCVHLPYSPEHLQPAHQGNCRACCTSFPTRVEDGVLFVWPESGPEAEKESAERDPPLIEELHDEELKKNWIKFPTNMRDLDLGWDVFFENAMDPAHFLVAHHNVTGNRYTDPKWFDMKTYKKMTTQGGCAAKGIPGTFDFRPPCMVKNQQDGGVIFAIYATPTMPGKCRHIGFLVLDTDTIAGDSGVVDKDAVSMFTGPVPIWLQHVTTSFFLHQDAVLLHHQEQNFRDKGFRASKDSDKTFSQVTYTPNEVDKGSIQFRRWLRTRAGGGVPWECDPTLPPRLPTNERIFSVWDSHTKHCRYCLDAYHNIRNMQTGAFGGALAAALIMPDGPERVVAGAMCVAVGAGLKKLGDLFVEYEFNHQDNV